MKTFINACIAIGLIIMAAGLFLYVGAMISLSIMWVKRKLQARKPGVFYPWFGRKRR